ncbi:MULTISPECIES: phosphatase PAP2 family protein [unclassified Embleya]|uniref:phosphatase PAP2 family protein n=1 Tax=unclassified Embleya TaxID=2699296 RepID=UPI0033CDFFBB
MSLQVLAESTDDNLDIEILRDVNGLTEHTSWAHGGMEFMGEYGMFAVLAVLALLAWWRARSRPDHTAAMAGLVWAPLAALVAELANAPLREWVNRPRPFLSHDGLHVLVAGKTDPSFASDHALTTMALAVGILVVDRRIGILAVLASVFTGFSRLYVGVHYPTDVLAGFALGALVALVGSMFMGRVLEPVVRLVERGPLRPLVAAEPRPAG